MPRSHFILINIFFFNFLSTLTLPVMFITRLTINRFRKSHKLRIFLPANDTRTVVNLSFTEWLKALMAFLIEFLLSFFSFSFWFYNINQFCNKTFFHWSTTLWNWILCCWGEVSILKFEVEFLLQCTGVIWRIFKISI